MGVQHKEAELARRGGVYQRVQVLTRVRAPQCGWTPLHIAALATEHVVARVLLESGADVNAKARVSDRRRDTMLGQTHGMCLCGGRGSFECHRACVAR